MKLRMAGPTALGICILLVGGLVAPSASASKIEAKQAEAARLQREIDANGEQISMLVERYDGAQLRLDEAKLEIVRVEAGLAAARAQARRVRAIVARRAANLYMGIGAQTPFGWTDVSSVNEVGRRSTYAAAASDKDTHLLDQLRASREDLTTAEHDLETARNKAQREVDALDAKRRGVEAANARQSHLLAQVHGEIARLIEQERARQAAEEKARSDARLRQLHLDAARAQADAQRATRVDSGTRAGNAGSDPSAVSIPDAPAPSPSAAAAVAYAKAQLGKPYRYAASGPDEFDCSGLTMMAWAQAGVSMPHYSAAQGAMFPRVPDGQLSPGDLVIYYPDEHHVAIYIGDGMTVAATQTGDFVKLQPVFRSGFQYAVRP